MVSHAHLGQLGPCPVGLRERRPLRAAHQDQGRQRNIGQRAQAGLIQRLLRLKSGQRSQAGGPRGARCHEPCPGARQLQQPQRVSGRGGVENDVIVVRRAGQQLGELVEGGDLGGAGPRQLLLHAPECGLGQHLAVWAHNALAVGPGGGLRVDVQGPKAGHARDARRLPRQTRAQDFIQVRRGVRAHQQNALASVGELDRRRASQRRLADAAFAREEEDPGGAVQEVRDLHPQHRR